MESAGVIIDGKNPLCAVFPAEETPNNEVSGVNNGERKGKGKLKGNNNIIVASPEALRLAELLFSEIAAVNPRSRLSAQNNGQRTTTVNRWAEDIDKLLRLDHQEPSTVEECIKWATHDAFWGANILSGRSLREKWDTLIAQKERQNDGRRVGIGAGKTPAKATGAQSDGEPYPIDGVY